MTEILEMWPQIGTGGVVISSLLLFIRYLLKQLREERRGYVKDMGKCHETLSALTISIARLNDKIDNQTQLLSVKIDSKQ